MKNYKGEILVHFHTIHHNFTFFKSLFSTRDHICSSSVTSVWCVLYITSVYFSPLSSGHM